MDEDNTSGVGKRSRKQTAFFEVKAAPVKGTNVGEGAGIKLAENPHFCQELDGTKSDSAVCQALHWLLFGSKGKKAEVKKNLRGFSGFTTEVSKDDKKVKVKQNKSVWTVSVLKEALGLFGLEKSGDREVLVNRMVEFLAEPAFTKAARAPGSGKKRKSAGKAGKKGSKRAKKGTAKRKTAPSAYILYCKEQRAALKEEQPELSMIEQTKVLGAKWNALDEDAKKVSHLNTFITHISVISILFALTYGIFYHSVFYYFCCTAMGGKGSACQASFVIRRSWRRHSGRHRLRQ